MRNSSRAAAALVTSLLALSACGSNSDLSLTPAGEAGQKIANSNGCAACHGTSGGGTVGPAFVGLFGSEVELEDGTTVIADADYLRTAISDPGAQRVAGYNLTMPTNSLSPAEIESVIDYITELADVDDGNSE